MLARRHFVAIAGLIAFTGSASAGEWPERPVRIIYPYAAGGTADITARLIARRLSDRFGQPLRKIKGGRASVTGAGPAEAQTAFR